MASLLLALLLAAPAQNDGGSPSLAELLAGGESVAVEQILFVLNEEIITTSMIEERASRMLRMRPEEDPRSLWSQALADIVLDLIALEGFRRLGLDEAAIAAEASARVDRVRDSYGSRARFEENLAQQGYTLSTFRDSVQGDLIRRTWRGVVTGQQSSPLKGLRERIDPSPSEILAEFERDPERWKQGFGIVWKVLQYHDNPQGPGWERAQAAQAALSSGAWNLAQAEADAQSVQALQGDPAERNLRPEIRDFLLNAEAGAASPVEPIPGLGGLIFVVVERSPARTIGFEEAQTRIAAELKQRKAEEAVMAAAQTLFRSSYTWYPDELALFFSQLFPDSRAPRESEF